MKTSIVIAAFNQLEFTRQCIESIRANTRAGIYEMIVIDNGSSDGTSEWLQAQPDIRHVRNERNLGFPKACNQGIEIAAGEAVLLLNNDTVVTPNWLEGLTACLGSDESIGAVGPVTNHCSYFQSIPVSYDNFEEMQHFARSYNNSDPSKWEERLKLIGFCMLVRKSVADLVGLLDERFAPGNYEDDDYSYRIRRAGYRLMLCMDTFIHHHGSVSWEDDEAFRGLLRENRLRHEEKWGFIPEHTYLVRYELAGRIRKPADAPIRVLDLECRGGGTLLLAKNRFRHAALYGVERNFREAECASLCAKVKTEDPLLALGTYPERFFDIVFLPFEPQAESVPRLLAAARRCLKPDGQVIGAFPNRLHYRRLKETIRGSANPGDPAGFTLSEAVDLFRQSGLSEAVVTGSMTPKSAEDEQVIKQLAQLGDGKPQTYEIASFIVAASTEDAVYCAIREIAEQRNTGWHIAAMSGYSPEQLIAVAEQRFDRPEDALQALGAAYMELGQIGKALPFMNRAMMLSSEPADSESSTGDAKDIRDLEQNDVPFTGERLVINKLVKKRFSLVMEEHLARYALASRYVNGKDVLDAACGAGYGSLMLLQAGARSVVGVDIAEESILNARRSYGREAIEFALGDVMKLEAADETFDVVVSFETIEHLHDGAAWFREAARVLKENGRFIVSTPNRYITNPGAYFDEQPLNPHHRFEYSANEFIGELLLNFELTDLFGQEVAGDQAGTYVKVMRQARGLDVNAVPQSARNYAEAELHPLGEIKDGQAMYLVAVCRKKRRG